METLWPWLNYLVKVGEIRVIAKGIMRRICQLWFVNTIQSWPLFPSSNQNKQIQAEGRVSADTDIVTQCCCLSKGGRIPSHIEIRGDCSVLSIILIKTLVKVLTQRTGKMHHYSWVGSSKNTHVCTRTHPPKGLSHG